MRLVTAEEMRLAEQAAVERGDTWEGLMERAGQAVAREVLARVKKTARRVLLLVGPGNNGGDALVAGRHLRESGLSVVAYLWNRGGGPADRLVEALTECGGEAMWAEADEGLQALHRELGQADVVVDGLLGMGLTRPIEGLLRDIVEEVNRASRPLVVAVDLPTGVHADTGQVLGVAVRAAVTVTMGWAKRGLYQFPGAGYAGDVVVADIGLPEELLKGVQAEVLDVERLRGALPARRRDGHKGTFGRVLVVAGSLHYTGAPYLAAMAAYRVGAGLVTLAPPRTIYPILAARALETTFLPLPEGEVGAVGEGAIKVLGEVIGRYQVLVLGCGLGQEEGTVTFVRRLLRVRERPQPGIGFLPRVEVEEFEGELPLLVLDADGLNALAGVPEWWKNLPPGRAILTPHPGEMARLLGASQEEVLASRISVAQRAATTWRQVVVFKGAYTVVAHPEGQVVVNPVACPALATAGTGDVLAGAIGGFLAQGVAPFEAALLGVYVHSLAGMMVEEEVGPAGGVAGQVLEALPRALRCFAEGKRRGRR
ncbi:MAG: NAD(P)H-hydrate dehydratase [Chloroflexia bacterium]